tara:strand:- start:56587 stop:57249 length:663 start_codon:yes stop_codon:yes gene_type:complete
MLLKRQLESSGAMVASIDVPLQDKGREIAEYVHYQEKCFENIQIQNAQCEALSPEIIILESNYGRPGQGIFCANLYDRLIELYPKAQFVISSTTSSSLVAAFQYDDGLMVMNAMLDSQTPEETLERIYSQTAMMAKIKKILAQKESDMGADAGAGVEEFELTEDRVPQRQKKEEELPSQPDVLCAHFLLELDRAKENSRPDGNTDINSNNGESLVIKARP